jgi:hypothetical protein
LRGIKISVDGKPPERRSEMEQTEEKKVAEVTDEQLAQLVAQNSRLQEQEMADGGIQPDYILLAKTGTKALNPLEKDLYVEGLAIGDFFIQKDKVKLGNELKVVPLMFLTVYNEMESKSRDSRFLGKWTQEQALQFPLAEGSYFDRQLPNGHILTPSHWVAVEVLGHRDIKFAVIAYKSTGSRIWKSWKEDVRKRSGASATLVYRLFADQYESTKGKWLDINYAFDHNLLEKDRNEAVYCLQKSNEMREAYGKNLLIQKHNLEAITAKPVVAQIEDASDVEESSGEEELGF